MNHQSARNFERLLISVAVSLLICACAVGVGMKQKPVGLESRGGEPERTPIYEHGGWIIARGSLHNHTTYSDGCRTPEDLVELARIQGVAVLAINDHREGVIKVGKSGMLRLKLDGVESYGYDVYLEHLNRAQSIAEEKGVILLKGFEFIPHIYNYGKAPFMVIGGIQEHFTVYGIDDPAVLDNAPVRDTIPLKPEHIPDETPWQNFVNYIVQNSGIVHAVHTEGQDDTWTGPVHGGFPAPIYNIHRLENLTGFSVLPLAWRKKVGVPGGIWDTTLLEYMAGMRKKPIWAVGDADYHCQASLAVATTLFYMKEFTEEEVYRCLREGRMVALQGDAFQDTYVSEWWINDSGAPENLIMHGEETTLKETPVIRFALNRPVKRCRVRLIRNGVIIHETPGTDFTFKDEEQGNRREPAFYRVEVVGPRAKRGEYDGTTMPQSELFVNPIFTRYRND